MSDPRDYKVELSSLPAAGDLTDEQRRAVAQGRPHLRVLFRCCNVYTRIFRNAEATGYFGRCPRCGKPVGIAIGPGGSSARYFEVT